MKISNNWLKKFIVTELKPNQISEFLTDLGLEVEVVSRYVANEVSSNGIVVGRVFECIPIDESKKLTLCKVEIGNSNVLDIICGAPNIKPNIHVPVALPKSKIHSLNGGIIEIKERKILNILSQAVICSSAELGLDSDHSGIMILDDQLQIGSVFQPPNPLHTDDVYDIGLTPNRADAMSHFGVARDLMATLKAKAIKHHFFRPVEPHLESIQSDKTIPIQIMDTHKCPKYFGITISDITVTDSPIWLQNLLKSIGINPKNNVVDATNYILHHLGQPLHAFDADKIDRQIIVKTCLPGTAFETLDGMVRILDSDDLMICDQTKPLCIAGVMGGDYSSVTQKTTSVFIESAYFDPISIRKTAKRHGLNTDASFRFERGVDPEIGILALKQVASLILDLAGGELSSKIQRFESPLVPPIIIDFNVCKMNDLVGKNISEVCVESILGSLDFKICHKQSIVWKIQIPSYRVDVTREIDVIEEVFRVFGINKVDATPIEEIGHILSYASVSNQEVNHRVSEFLCHHGFFEIYTNSLVSPSDIETIPEAVEVLNSIGEDYSFLRQSFLPSMLHTLQYNIHRGNKDLKFFEFGSTYHTDRKNPFESRRLSLAITGNALNKTWVLNNTPSPFFYLKGILNDLFDRLAINIKTKAPSKNKVCHPHIDILNNQQNIGFYGLIPSHQLGTAVAYAELDWDIVSKIAYQKDVRFQSVSKYPTSTRDFSLLLDKSVSYQSIEDLAYKTAEDILKKVELFDVYDGENLPKNKISYGVSFMFQNNKRTLTDAEINQNMDRLQKAFEQKLGVILR
ncbi:MAG: phenylalanine--tRNA ligase subunit beta [Flavobacteriaceae bacterium]|nr:phenylalanine--tRNA ligase subunit beta [Flavobacteriaceae bacterium]